MEANENKKVKKSVKIRLEKEARKETQKLLSGKQGAVSASLRNFPSAARKMRLVADMIRGQRVSVALNFLKFDKTNQNISPKKWVRNDKNDNTVSYTHLTLPTKRIV